MKIEEMIVANRADCSGCEACANICPKNAITMTRDAEGFAYPKINPELCIKCGRCDATCPALNFKAKKIDKLPPTFVAIYDDAKILRHSAAGGVFTALSDLVLKDGGIIFGAAFDKNWRVQHTSAENLDELENLRRSKYVQSQIGSVYRQIKEALKSRKVLFSGTPCQCAGLKNFLGEDSENLLTVEIICHGVPSPALWENYIDEVGYAHEIKHVNFRSKRTGWGSNIDINFADQPHTFTSNQNNLYGRLFLKALSERPSCHACKFKFPNGQADLTLGDAWGIKDFAPEMHDARGVSLVFVHTAKGKDFFGQANLKVKQVPFIEAARRNPRFMAAGSADSRRKDFFADLAANKDWLAVMKKYYAQDDTEISKIKGGQNWRTYIKNLREIAAQIRPTFEKNILIISAPINEIEQNILAQKYPNCGVYILRLKEGGLPFCREIFSGLTFDQKDAAALADFVKKFNVTEIFIKDKIDSPVVEEFLKDCGLPVQTL